MHVLTLRTRRALLANLPPRRPPPSESGQVMFDRTRHLDVLEWVWFLNAFGKGHLYEFMYGDKVRFV